MRAAAQLWAPLAAALGLTAAALFFGGGSGDGSLPWLGGAAIVLALVFAATRPLPGGLLPLAPLGLLAVWSAVSVAWSIEPDRSWAYANRGLVYLAFALVGAFAADRMKELMFGLAAILGAVCAWSLGGKALPWLADDDRLARLSAPIGYWNSLALLGAIALPIGLCLATRRRVLGALLVYGWIVVIVLTLSRGGALVAVLVVAAWIVLSRAWVEALATLVAAGVPAAVVIAIAFSLDGVTSDAQSHSTRVSDGAIFGIALLAGLGVAALLGRVAPPQPTRAVRRAALALVAVLAAAALVVGATHAGSWWDTFTSPTVTALPNDSPSRLADAGSNYRWTWWKQAWRAWEDHPAAGTGAGSFHFTNLRYRTTNADVAQEPHSLPVQFLTETGIVGLLLFVVAGLGLAAAARRRPGPQLALALALPAYLVHGLVDIGWDFAAVSAPVFLIAGAVAARPDRARRLSGSALLVGGGVAVAVVCSLFAVWLSDRWTGQAFESLDRPAHAVMLAKRARSINPLAVEPLRYQAYGEQSLGNLGDALGLFQKATELQPENGEAWFALAEFDLNTRKCPHAALPEFDRFTQLNPQDKSNKEYDRALALVNSGTAIC